MPLSFTSHTRGIAHSPIHFPPFLPFSLLPSSIPLSSVIISCYTHLSSLRCSIDTSVTQHPQYLSVTTVLVKGRIVPKLMLSTVVEASTLYQDAPRVHNSRISNTHLQHPKFPVSLSLTNKDLEDSKDPQSLPDSAAGEHTNLPTRMPAYIPLAAQVENCPFYTFHSPNTRRPLYSRSIHCGLRWNIVGYCALFWWLTNLVL